MFSISITEDTARRLEALQNSQHGETITIRNLLAQYLPAIDETYLPTIQANVARIDANMAAMLNLTSHIDEAINQMRNGVQPLHVTMS